MNVEILKTLVARQKQLNAELEAIKGHVQTHESAIEALYAQGQPLADEARSISNELKTELGLIERPAGQGLAPAGGGCAGGALKTAALSEQEAQDA